MPSRFLNNITVNDSYTLPSADGDADQIIQTDGAGNLSFVDLSSIEGAASNFVYFEVKNETGSPINKGKGVMAVGTDGNSGHILIDEMIADGSVEPKYFLGVLETTVANGGFARVISFGQLDQFDTRGQNGETWSDGQILWCDPDSAGDFTITEPDGPNVKIAAAFILNSSTSGKIQVRVQANEGVHDLHDTKITSQVDGDVLVWDNTTGVWFNDSTLNVDYAAGNVGIGTTSPSAKFSVLESTANTEYASMGSGGTVSRHLKFSGFVANGTNNVGHRLSALNAIALNVSGNDALYIDRDSNVGIGTTSPRTKLHVSGLTGDDDPSLGASAAPLFVSNTANSYGLNVGVNNSGDAWLQAQSNTAVTAYDILLNPLGGNVGIGTTSPEHKLHVENTESASWTTRFSNTVANSNNIYFGYNNGTTSYGMYIDGGQGAAGYDIQTTSGFVVRGDGKVGIGTTNPISTLEVDGQVLISNTAPFLDFVDTNGFTDVNDRFRVRAGTNQGLIQWYDGSTSSLLTLMTLNQSGNVIVPNGNVEVLVQMVVGF